MECERCRRTSGSVIAEVAQRRPIPSFFEGNTGVWTVRGTQNMTAIDNRFPKPRPLLGPGRPVAF